VSWCKVFGRYVPLGLVHTILTLIAVPLCAVWNMQPRCRCCRHSRQHRIANVVARSGFNSTSLCTCCSQCTATRTKLLTSSQSRDAPLYLILVAPRPQLFCEMLVRRRFDSEAVRFLQRLLFVFCCLHPFLVLQFFVAFPHTQTTHPSIPYFFLQPALRLNLILEIAKASCSGIMCASDSSAVHDFIR
jgi:hypothetical protein